MKKYLFAFFLFLLFLPLHALEIDQTDSDISIFKNASIYFDKNGSYTKNELNKIPFKKNNTESLSFGFVPHATLWIKFTLQNKTAKPLKKIIEYSDAITEELYFYDGNKILKDGMWHIPHNRTSIYPSFTIILKPHEKRTYYMQAHSNISTLIAKLSLFSTNEFIKHDYERKSYLFVFFAILFTLLLYNMMLLIFTKDKAYLYYILYIFSVIFFQANYLGVAQLYFFSNTIASLVAKGSLLYISFMIISIILFTREFLNTKNFPKLDKTMLSYLYFAPPIAILGFNNYLFNMNIVILFVPLGILVAFSGFYALYKGVKQAKYYVIGWSFVIVSLILTNLRTMGLFNFEHYFAYFNELAFALEALLFSIALAHRIKIANDAKNKSDAKLIKFQNEQNEKLEHLVHEKTKHLSIALEEKELLYRELNHRVKNNLQMILSLIKLQISQTKNNVTTAELEVTKNRINSISKLYESLYLQQEDTHHSTSKYFKQIVENLKQNSPSNVQVVYNINFNLSLDNTVYCGLILNELVTNSFKHAFKQNGIIEISLFKKVDTIYFIIQDNGIGFVQSKHNSLGLVIVDTLVQKQLLGECKIESDNGTKVTIKWKDNG